MAKSKVRGGAKAHRKKVEARNQKLKNQQKAAQKILNDMMTKQMEEARILEETSGDTKTETPMVEVQSFDTNVVDNVSQDFVAEEIDSDKITEILRGFGTTEVTEVTQEATVTEQEVTEVTQETTVTEQEVTEVGQEVETEKPVVKRRTKKKE